MNSILSEVGGLFVKCLVVIVNSIVGVIVDEKNPFRCLGVSGQQLAFYLAQKSIRNWGPNSILIFMDQHG